MFPAVRAYPATGLRRRCPAGSFCKHSPSSSYSTTPPRPDVDALVHSLTPGLFGRHVGCGAKDDSCHSRAYSQGGESAASASASASRDSGLNAFASPKSNSFSTPSGVTFTFAGFRSRWITPLFVRIFQRVGDLHRDLPGILEGHRALGRLAFDQLHDQCPLFHAVNLGDVGMIE